MKNIIYFLVCAVMGFSQLNANGQQIEKISYQSAAAGSYYLAIPPVSHQVRGIVLLVCSFKPAESLLPETRLHNIAAANDVLTVYASAGPHLFADSTVTGNLNALIKDLTGHYQTGSAPLILGGFDYAGGVVLRYAELALARQQDFPTKPAAVFTADSFTDLFSLKTWCDRQIKKNYFQGAVSDAKALLNFLPKDTAALNRLSPFNHLSDATVNEQYLQTIPVRLYYDADIEWQLKERHNSLYDTNLPDGSELISRLLAAGNKHAELITAKQPGRRSNGMRSPNALSIIDETDFMAWAKKVFHIFDPLTWEAPYQLSLPGGWRTERFLLPPPFAKGMGFNGVEEAFFPPGWADPKSPDYWSYAYTWTLDGNLKIDPESLRRELTLYFDGLVASNGKKGIPAIVKIASVKPGAGDTATFSGTVKITDYMSGKAIVLNTLIHQKACSQAGQVVLLYEFTPKPFEEQAGQALHRLNASFRCQSEE